MAAWVTSVPLQLRRSAFCGICTEGRPQRAALVGRGGPVCRRAFVGAGAARPLAGQIRAAHAGPAAADQSVLQEVDHAVVLFRVGDLRVLDHPGLLAAKLNTRLTLAPLFVFTPETPPAAYPAVDRLRADLRARGSELYVRFAESEARGLASFVLDERPCGRVHIRREVDARALESVRAMEERLCESGVEFVLWRDELRHLGTDDIRLMPDDYPAFLKWKPRRDARLDQPELEYEPALIIPGPPGTCSENVQAADSSLEAGELSQMQNLVDSMRPPSELDGVEKRFNADCLRVGVIPPSAEAVPNERDYGEHVVLDVLQRLEKYEIVDIGRALQDVFWLGLVSMRRMRALVVEFERTQGRLFAFSYRAGAKTLLRYLDAREFAGCLAERDLAAGDVLVDGYHRPKFYRWRGFLARYVEAGEPSLNSSGKPAMLFIHGFGASAQHWGRNIEDLSTDYHCFAFCNIGFGRAEKPPFQYTQQLWEIFQAEFVRDVVKSKCIVIGNSIGGYLSAAFASDAPSVCAGLVLVNTAGAAYNQDEYEAEQQALKKEGKLNVPSKPGKRSLITAALQESRLCRELAGNLLLLYLRGNIEKTLMRVYPTVEAASWTAELAEEIRRNSLDSGAVDVIASGFVLPPQRPLNELLHKDGPPVLVFQGKLDPLGSSGRVEKLKTIISPDRVTFRIIEAGHCPHDEKPVLFCNTLREWASGTLTEGASLEPEPSPKSLAT